MAYTPTYESTDFATLLFDFMGFVIAVLIDNAVILVSLIIATIVLYLFRDILSALFGSIFSLGKRRK